MFIKSYELIYCASQSASTITLRITSALKYLNMNKLERCKSCTQSARSAIPHTHNFEQFNGEIDQGRITILALGEEKRRSVIIDQKKSPMQKREKWN